MKRGNKEILYRVQTESREVPERIKRGSRESRGSRGVKKESIKSLGRVRKESSDGVGRESGKGPE